MNTRSLAAIFVSAAWLAACGDETSALGVDAEMVIPNATYLRGVLPGTPPPDDEATGQESTDGSGEPVGPAVTAVELVGGSILPGEQGKTISGRTDETAFSVAIAYGDDASGYWVRTVEGQDPSSNNERGFTFSANFAHFIEPGLHPVRVVAIDGDGVAGEQRETLLCVGRPVPDNLNACRDTIEPPHTVLSLSWSSDADVDLVVVSPSGKVVSPKAPTSAPVVDGVVQPEAPGVGVLDRDARCGDSAVRRENVVFEDTPESGTWLVYANLFETCDGKPAIFEASIHRAESAGEGTWTVREAFTRTGVLMPASANGGDALGTFVFEVTL